MTAIVIGGTPGTGKTKVAQVLGTLLASEVISLSELAQKSGCIAEEDRLRDTGIINEDCLVEAIEGLIEERNKRLVVEGHYIDLVPYSHVEAAFVLRTHPSVLRKRLTERGYPKSKVDENVEAEVIGVCQMDAIESFGEAKVFEIDSTEQTPKQVAELIVSILKGKEHNLRIDWMELLEKEGSLDDYFTPEWTGDDFP